VIIALVPAPKSKPLESELKSFNIDEVIGETNF